MIYIRVMHSRAMKHVVSISDHRAGWVLKPNWGEWGCQRFWPHIMFRLASQMSIDDYLTQTDEDVDISSATWLSMMYPSLGRGLVVPDELKLMIDVSCWRTHGSFFLLGLELMLVWSFLRKWAKRAEGTPLIGLRVSPYVIQNFRLGSPEMPVSNEIWAIGPNFMTNSYSIFNLDTINVLRFGCHHSSSWDIWR